MPKLCVNIDHIATVREARKGIEPDPTLGAELAINAGADGITVHLREDRRHINDRDVILLRKKTTGVLFTLEMAATDEMLKIASNIKPDLITLVPEKRQELTTEGGLDVIKNKGYLKEYIEKLHRLKLTVSIFINADKEQIKTAKEICSNYIEIHTGPYANNPNKQELDRVKDSISCGLNFGLKVNAGHGLNYENTKPIAEINGIDQLHIGHSIISRSVLYGIKDSIIEMKKIVSSNKKFI